MRPLRKHVAISIDGGGIKGILVTRAMAVLESYLRRPLHTITGLAVGTSTGSIISAGLTVGLTAQEMYELYVGVGPRIFQNTLRSRLWPLMRYRYSLDPLREVISEHIGDLTMGELWQKRKPADLVITTFDVVQNRTRFVKPWKPSYADWPLTEAVLASSSVPTYFPPVAGRFVDGGVGSYANPCYIAAFELSQVLRWPLHDTTLISLGTGRAPNQYTTGDADRFWAWDWVAPVLGAFSRSAGDQQVHLVDAFFEDLDFRRFQVDLDERIEMDDPDQVELLTAYGDELGRRILDDETEQAVDFRMLHRAGLVGW